jgi:hypothetical protein
MLIHWVFAKVPPLSAAAELWRLDPRGRSSILFPLSARRKLGFGFVMNHVGSRGAAHLLAATYRSLAGERVGEMFQIHGPTQ